jgi:spoIIIJ-associated protein
MARTIVIEGRSLEDALEEATRRLGRTPVEGDYALLENRAGFWGMNRKVILELTLGDDAPLDPVEPEAVPEEAMEPEPPVAPARPVPRPTPSVPSGDDPAIDFVRRSTEEIVLGIGLELTAQVRRDAERIRVELSGPDTGRLSANRGELIQSIQYLLGKLAARKEGAPIRIDVDAGGYREKRQQELAALAKKTADAVRKGKKRALLPPMAPAERREIHLALADDPDVTTESEGDGFRKRVAVFLRDRSR